MKPATSRVLLVVAVAVLVALAGCGADQPDGGLDSTPEETTLTTVSPTDSSPQTTDATTTQGNADEEQTTYPTGFDESGYENTTTAIKQHTQLLSTISFTSATVYETPSVNSTIILAANATDRRVYMEVIRDGAVVQQHYFENGTRYSRVRADGSLEYDNESMSYGRALVFDGQYENIAGSTLSFVNRTETNLSAIYTYSVVDQEGVEQSATTGNLTVIQSGLIPQYRIVSEHSSDRSVVEYRLSKVGSTAIEEPSWVTKA